jgi:hypothetical protein
LVLRRRSTEFRGSLRSRFVSHCRHFCYFVVFRTGVCWASDGAPSVGPVPPDVQPVVGVSILGAEEGAMAGPGALKRIKELKRQEKNQEKAADREKRRREKVQRGDKPGGEDPDIAGIVPGPQPPMEG